METSVISDAAEKDKLEGLKFDQEKLASQLKEVKESFKAHSEDIDKKFNDVLRKATALSLADEKGPGGLDPDKMIIEALKIRQKALKELHDEYLISIMMLQRNTRRKHLLKKLRKLNDKRAFIKNEN